MSAPINWLLCKGKWQGQEKQEDDMWGPFDNDKERDREAIMDHGEYEEIGEYKAGSELRHALTHRTRIETTSSQ
jgi:hypothetical protein